VHCAPEPNVSRRNAFPKGAPAWPSRACPVRCAPRSLRSASDFARGVPESSARRGVLAVSPSRSSVAGFLLRRAAFVRCPTGNRGGFERPRAHMNGCFQKELVGARDRSRVRRIRSGSATLCAIRIAPDGSRQRPTTTNAHGSTTAVATWPLARPARDRPGRWSPFDRGAHKSSPREGLHPAAGASTITRPSVALGPMRGAPSGIAVAPVPSARSRRARRDGSPRAGRRETWLRACARSSGS
jgi:hypothetical protein